MYAGSVTQAVKRLIDEYDALSESERREALIEILRRAAMEPHEAPSDEDLVATADAGFQELDRASRFRTRS